MELRKIDPVEIVDAPGQLPAWSHDPEGDNISFLALTLAVRARDVGMQAYVDSSAYHNLEIVEGDTASDWMECRTYTRVVTSKTRYLYINDGRGWWQVRISDHVQTAHARHRYGRPDLEITLPCAPAFVRACFDSLLRRVIAA